MPPEPELLAQGPWNADQVESTWREEAFDAGPEAEAAADEAIAALRERGSPSHDGPSGRLVSYEVNGDTLHLELQPARWALRLGKDAHASMTVLCVVRSADGSWLAGR